MNYFLHTVKVFGPIAVFAFFLTVFLILLAIKIFPKIGLMDRPRKYGLRRAPIPYYGGIAIFISFLISVLIFAPLSRELFGVLLAGGLIVFVGFFDDYFSLKPLTRIVFQVLAVLILLVFGIGISSFKIPFFGVVSLDRFVADFVLFGVDFSISFLGAVFLIFWVLLIVNAMNFLDGISGLNSGVCAIASLTIFVLSIHPGVHENPASQTGVAILALIVAMIAFAFLVFDFPKPVILMGDTGSTFFGFMLAVLSIFSGGKVATAVLVLGIPLLDLFWVVFRRTFFEKRKFWQGDLKHMHHRFLDMGLSPRSVVFIYLLISFVFGLFAIMFVDTAQKFFMLIALLILMVILGLFLVFGKYKSLR